MTLGRRALLPDSDYTIDPNRGLIAFRRPLSATDTARIVFSRLSFTLPTNIQADGAVESDVDAIPVTYTVPAAIPPARSSRPDLRPGQAIQWQGYKSFAVRAGDGRTADWSQGLELSVDGEIASGLELHAAVSDRLSDQIGATGARESGTRIGDLDRLFVEVRSPSFLGRWGELDLPDRDGALSTSRRATGMRVAWDNGSRHAGGYIGRAQGRWVQRQLIVEPGNSGPYVLNERPSATGIIRGSVTVRLDGRRLDEGPDADYIVDYRRHRITFLPRVALTSASVCTVEFEQALESYRRTLAGMDWRWSRSDRKLSTRSTVRWEGEDPDGLLIGSLTESQRAQLADADTPSLRASAAEWVGSRAGDYDLKVSPAGDSVFSYVGPENGDWRVGFEWVGPGEGRYRRLALDAYEFVGAGAGEYEPTTTVTAATAQFLIAEAVTFRPASASRVDLSWEGVADDPNRFASNSTRFSQNHSIGLAFGGLADERTISGFSWRWDRRGAVSAFSLSHDRRTELTEQWALHPRYLDSTFSEHALTSVLGTGSTSLRAAGGTFGGNRFNAWRAGVGLQSKLWHGARAELSGTLREAKRVGSGSMTDHASALRATTDVNTPVGLINAHWGRQEYTRRYNLFYGRSPEIQSAGAGIARFGIALRYAHETAIDTITGVRRRHDEVSLHVPAPILRAVAGSGLSLAHGTESHAGLRSSFSRGQLHGEWTPVRSARVTSELRLLYGRHGNQREVYLPTRPGTGDYRLERGEYVPDPFGDYQRVVSEDETQSTAAYDGLRRVAAEWHPRVGAWRLRLEMRREVAGRYTPEEFGVGRWLLIWPDMTDALLPSSQAEARQFYRLVADPNRTTTVSLSTATDRRLTGSSGTGDQNLNRTEVSLRQRLPRRFFVEGAWAYEHRTRGTGSALALDAQARTVMFTAGISNTLNHPGAVLSLATELRRRIEDERLMARRHTLWGVKPTLKASLRRFSMRLSGDAVWLDAPDDLSAFLSENRPPGYSIRTEGEVRWDLPGRVSLSARVHGDHREVGADRWRALVETTARF